MGKLYGQITKDPYTRIFIQQGGMFIHPVYKGKMMSMTGGLKISDIVNTIKKIGKKSAHVLKRQAAHALTTDVPRLFMGQTDLQTMAVNQLKRGVGNVARVAGEEMGVIPSKKRKKKYSKKTRKKNQRGGGHIMKHKSKMKTRKRKTIFDM